MTELSRETNAKAAEPNLPTIPRAGITDQLVIDLVEEWTTRPLDPPPGTFDAER
jgi:hypothetical protein